MLAIPHRKHAVDIRLFIPAQAGKLEAEEEPSSCVWGAVRCSFKDNCWIMPGNSSTGLGTSHAAVALQNEKGVGRTCDTHS